MKKFAISLLASLACMQVAPAGLLGIPSNLGESLIQYQTIISSDLISSAISQNEFIIDIKRLTRDTSINSGIVRYEIITSMPRSEENSVSSVMLEPFETRSGRHRDSTTTYIVLLQLTPNPQIGPPIATVISIKPTRTQHTFHVNTATDLETFE